MADAKDLTNDLEFTLRLLDDTWAWRQRLVETCEFRSLHHIAVRSSLQLEFPPGMIEQWVPGDAKHINALIPLATRPKRPLLGFDLVGPQGRPAHLLPRASIAAIQAEFLRRLVEGSPAGAGLTGGLEPDLLEALCVFTPGTWREFKVREGSELESLTAYLSEGTGLDFDERAVFDVLTAVEAAASQLLDVLDEEPEPDSSAENILLALPLLKPFPGSVQEALGLAARFAESIDAATRAGDRALLVALGDYGRRWEVIVEAEVPVREPTTIKFSEERPLKLRPHGWVTQQFSLGDARSAHFQARVADSAVELGAYTVEWRGRTVGVPLIEAASHTRETFALYSSDPERPFYVTVGIRLRVLGAVRAVMGAVGALTAFALVAALLIPGNGALAEGLAVVTLPTTFAVALVVVREQTTLAVRLHQWPRRLLLLLVFVLWVVSVLRMGLDLPETSSDLIDRIR